MHLFQVNEDDLQDEVSFDYLSNILYISLVKFLHRSDYALQ